MKSSALTMWHESIEALAGSWVADEERAGDASLYVAIGAMRRAGPGQRGGADDVRAFPGVFVDLDIAGGAHTEKATPLPTEEEVALLWAKLDALGLPPTLVLRSSVGGLYGYWLFREPFAIESKEDRARLERLLRGVQAFVRGLLAEVAGAPRHLDGTADLARVTRPAGAQNKKPAYRRADGTFPLVEFVERREARYNPSDIEEFLEPFGEAGFLRGDPEKRAPFTGELPAEVPTWIAAAADALGGLEGVRRNGEGRVSALVLGVCPCCGGLQKDGRTARGSAHVAPLLGALRCKRESCEARGEGLAFETWAPRYISSDELRRVRELREVSRGRARLPYRLDADAPAMSVSEARAGGFERLMVQAIEDLSLAGTILVFDPQVGTGKTRTIAEIVVREPGGYVVFVRDYRLRDELVAMIRALNHDVPIALPEGVSKACRLGADVLTKWGAEYDANGVQTKAPRLPGHWRGTACAGCTLRDDCAAHAKPNEGDLIVAVSQLDEHVPDPDVAKFFGDEVPVRIMRGRTVIYDETPPTTDVAPVTSKDLEHPLDFPALYSIFNSNDGAKDEHDRIVREGSRELRGAFERLVDKRRERIKELPANAKERRFPDRLPVTADTFTASEGDALRLLARVDRGTLHRPAGDSLREGRVGREGAPREKLVDAWQGLARASGIVPEAGRKEESVELVVSDARVVVEVVRPRALIVPPDGRALVLDATVALELEALRAANPRRRLVPVAVNVEPDPGSERVRLAWIVARALDRGSLLKGGGVRTGALGRVRGALRAAAEEARRQGLEPAELRVGVITYKGLADRLKSDPAALEAVLRDCGGWRLDPAFIGHFGGDSRGTNRFEECGALLTLGDPVANLGAERHKARALGLEDPDRYVRSRTLAELEQALGRLRPLNGADGPRLAFHLGAICPASWDGDEGVPRVELAPDDGWLEEGLETALAALASGIPLLVDDLAGGYAPGAIEDPNSTRRISSGRPGEATRKRAHERAAELVEEARDRGLELLVEQVRVPGRPGRRPRVLRPAAMPAEEAGRLIAERLTGEPREPQGARERLDAPQVAAKPCAQHAAAQGPEEVVEVEADNVGTNWRPSPIEEADEEVVALAAGWSWDRTEELFSVRRFVLAPRLEAALGKALAGAAALAGLVLASPFAGASPVAPTSVLTAERAFDPATESGRTLRRAIAAERPLTGPWVERWAADFLADALGDGVLSVAAPAESPSASIPATVDELLERINGAVPETAARTRSDPSVASLLERLIAEALAVKAMVEGSAKDLAGLRNAQLADVVRSLSADYVEPSADEVASRRSALLRAIHWGALEEEAHRRMGAERGPTPLSRLPSDLGDAFAFVDSLLPNGPPREALLAMIRCLWSAPPSTPDVGRKVGAALIRQGATARALERLKAAASAA